MYQAKNAPDFSMGEKITEPGIYTGVDIERYHGDICDKPSVSSTGLRTIFDPSAGPADYFVHSPYNPEREPEEPKEAFILGRAAHHLLFGERHFRKVFVERPLMVAGEPWQSNRTVCRQWVAEQAKAGKTIVTGEHYKKISGMARSLEKHPLVKAGILGGRIEQSMLWRDPKTGLWLKARPDAIPTDDADFADLKTAFKVDDDSLERAMDEYLYYMQAALVGLGSQALLSVPMQSFHFVFVQSKPPYSVNVKRVKDSDLKEGAENALLALEVFKHCLETGEWFGPAGTQSDASYLSRKPWATERSKARFNTLTNEVRRWTMQQAKPAPGLA